jgi:hypothetical protein
MAQNTKQWATVNRLINNRSEKGALLSPVQYIIFKQNLAQRVGLLVTFPVINRTFMLHMHTTIKV